MPSSKVGGFGFTSSRRGRSGRGLWRSSVEVVGYSVEIGFWVKIVLADDNLLFNGFTLMRTNFRDEVRDFMAKISRIR
jgi:hypothetical protein